MVASGVRTDALGLRDARELVKHMTRRKWLSTVLVGAHVVLLSCGGDDEAEQSSPSEPGSRVGTGIKSTNEPRQLTLAVLDTPFAVNPAQKAIQEWSKGNIDGDSDETQLELVKVPLQAGAREFLAARGAGGVNVDLIWLPIREDIPALFKTGLIGPLDRWLQLDQDRPMEAFAEEARRLVRFRSQTLALPIAVAPGVLAHNASRFRDANQAAPTHEWTWDDFIETGKRLTEDRNGDGTIDRWGFAAAGFFPDWLPFLLQEDVTIADLDTGEIGLGDPASLRALSAWDELGRVHGILPYGPDVTVEKLFGWNDLNHRGMHFAPFRQRMPDQWQMVTPLPKRDRNTTPLVLVEALAIPAAADGDRAYEVLVPLARWLGERRALPAVTAGWQYLQKPDREHFDLIYPESVRTTALQALTEARASHVASSLTLTQALFNIITWRLARDEVGIEQAIEQAANWLQSYVNE